MQKQYLSVDKKNRVIFPDTIITRNLNAQLKDGWILINGDKATIIYKNRSETVRLKEVAKKDRYGYYI